ncbi:hypothetical protein [Paenibacillus sp. XY044]|uniref:hypothetical protein n=1 Tax=Paenibacillus sp. XY044 TaxID=2026089 RepID=UPI000B9877FC|nr:hypothetical protein [Paenibacillus sp. XY044]OZB98051.1 hypothetical protein CJP46_02475 [Paenibacillus sp. XY044]
MNTDSVKARSLLKTAKQDILKMYGWTAKDYSARISETKQGLKLNIKLLVPRKGFKTICDFLIDKVGTRHSHVDVMHKSVLSQVESIIEQEVEKGIDYGSISSMDWIVYSTEGSRKVQNSTIRFMNSLYDYSIA